MKNIFIICLLLFSNVFCSMKLQLSLDEEALCWTGQREQLSFNNQSFYFEAGNGTGSNKWIIYFQGGGWIGGSSLNATLNSAYSRSSTNLGSSNSLSAEMTQGGIFNRNSVSNPELFNWNYIFVNYCDGTAFTWTQYISDQFKNAQVLSAPDSGIFQDFPTFDGTIDYKTFYQLSFMQLSNVEVDPPNKQCIAQNQNQKWKCLFAQYLIGYITVPMYIIQSPYDSWCIPNILKIKCANDGTLTRCTDKERSFVEAHSSNIQIILNGRFSHYNNTGAFAPACLKHCFLTSGYNSATFQVPGGSGNTISKGFAAWIVNQVETITIQIKCSGRIINNAVKQL